MDTFRKILAIEFGTLKKSIHRNNVKAIEIQIAKKASDLRIMDEAHSIDQRIDGYINLMNYISEIRKKLTPQI